MGQSNQNTNPKTGKLSCTGRCVKLLIVFTQTKVANRNIGIEAKRCVEKQGYSASKPPLSEEESTVPWMFFRAAVEDSTSCILQVSVSGSSAKV
jgi:hypothetical protein